ncbi:MAG: glycosyltransferase [Myxococcota bacterium]
MIPPFAHFIWFGPRFPWVNAWAIRSAVVRGGFDRVVLHHDSDLGGQAPFDELLGLSKFEARQLRPRELFEVAGARRDALIQIYDSLEKPNARANMVRAAILAREGGVYLDTDTITVRSLDALRRASGFCGEERVVLPVRELTDRRAHQILKRWALMGLREVCRRQSGGWRSFRRFEAWYPTAVNNAVLGAEAQHPFILRLLSAMAEVPEPRRRMSYALGTHLLQQQLSSHEESASREGWVIHPPPVFYPIGPEVSQHWFRLNGVYLKEILTDETTVVHWYQSVRTKDLVRGIDPDYVRAHADRQMFSALVLPLMEAQ